MMDDVTTDMLTPERIKALEDAAFYDLGTIPIRKFGGIDAVERAGTLLALIKRWRELEGLVKSHESVLGASSASRRRKHGG